MAKCKCNCCKCGIKEKIGEFLKNYCKKDHPDMDDSIVELLMDNHSYYIDDENNQGWFVPKTMSLEDEDVHKYVLENCE